MKALQVSRSVRKLGMARIASAISPVTATKLGPLEYTSVDEPALPGDGWHHVHTRLAGICGSDLSLVEGHASLYFEDWVSFPFVPGHEVVGVLDDGTRVILEPVLGHEARGFAPPFEGAAPGDGDDYAHLATGPLGARHPDRVLLLDRWWLGTRVRRPRVATPPHRRRHARRARRAGRAVRRRHPRRPARGTGRRCSPGHRIGRTAPAIVAVLGAGTMGLAAIAGLRRYVPDVRIIAGARYPHQRQFAKEFGADVVVAPDELPRAVRRAAGCHMVGDHLSSGAHVTIDAVGTSATVADCLRITRPRGRVVLLGMPADVTLDLTGLWHRETELKGAYTYGTEHLPDGRTVRTFDLAIETANELRAERLLSATYPLSDHVDAIAHAATAGRRGAVKVAFDLRKEDT